MKRDPSESDDESRSEPPGNDKSSDSPEEGRSDPAVRLHRPVGNQALQRLHESGAIQAKLEVSQPDDEHEREADRVAEEVVRSQAEEPGVDGEDEGIQRKADAGGRPSRARRNGRSSR